MLVAEAIRIAVAFTVDVSAAAKRKAGW